MSRPVERAHAVAAAPQKVAGRQAVLPLRIERLPIDPDGFAIDALAPVEELVAGDRVEVALQVYNGGRFEARVDSATLVTPAGWPVEALTDVPVTVAPGTLQVLRFGVTVPPDARASQPYFLERPRLGGLYDWSAAPATVRGMPFEPPPLTARVAVLVLGSRIRLTREVSHRFNDQARGEVRRPLRVVPAVDVRLEPDVVVWPAGGSGTRRFTVTLRSLAAAEASGTVRLAIDGWPSPPPVPFTLARAGDVRTVTFDLARPKDVARAGLAVEAVARTASGKEFREHAAVVEYPHIRPTQYLRSAKALIRVAPLTLPSVTRVGYVRGASDRVPDALGQVGLPVELLTPEELAGGDLSRFDAIVVGSRAYETDTALVRHNQRLLAYAGRGGLVVVQYQQYAFVQGRFAPYRIDIARPHDRVADETAPVKLLAPEHPVFTRPNRIESSDWNDWPQERGLYFAGSWDAAYTPLLEMSDPGEAPLRGGLLVARVGAGSYVYTGLAFFRALPAGVPGAYRLFLNLLALGRE